MAWNEAAKFMGECYKQARQDNPTLNDFKVYIRGRIAPSFQLPDFDD